MSHSCVLGNVGRIATNHSESEINGTYIKKMYFAYLLITIIKDKFGVCSQPIKFGGTTPILLQGDYMLLHSYEVLWNH